MVIDKPRRHHQPVGIDGARRGAAELAHLDNLAVVHRHVATKRMASPNHRPPDRF